MQKARPSDEALQEITNTAAAALTSPGETVTAIAVFVLVEGPDGPRGQWAMHPDGASDAMLRYLRDDIDRILGGPNAR